MRLACFGQTKIIAQSVSRTSPTAARATMPAVFDSTEHPMVQLEFHDPAGALDVTQPHAPRLDTIAGKKIGIVTNEQWQAYRTLPLIKSLFEKDFPGVEILPIDAFPQGNAVIGEEETARMVKDSGVDAVIIGNAA
jgi:hypothetical protein